MNSITEEIKKFLEGKLGQLVNDSAEEGFNLALKMVQESFQTNPQALQQIQNVLPKWSNVDVSQLTILKQFPIQATTSPFRSSGVQASSFTSHSSTPFSAAPSAFSSSQTRTSSEACPQGQIGYYDSGNSKGVLKGIVGGIKPWRGCNDEHRDANVSDKNWRNYTNPYSDVDPMINLCGKKFVSKGKSLYCLNSSTYFNQNRPSCEYHKGPLSGYANYFAASRGKSGVKSGFKQSTLFSAPPQSNVSAFQLMSNPQQGVTSSSQYSPKVKSSVFTQSTSTMQGLQGNPFTSVSSTAPFAQQQVNPFTITPSTQAHQENPFLSMSSGISTQTQQENPFTLQTHGSSSNVQEHNFGTGDEGLDIDESEFETTTPTNIFGSKQVVQELDDDQDDDQV